MGRAVEAPQMAKGDLHPRQEAVEVTPVSHNDMVIAICNPTAHPRRQYRQQNKAAPASSTCQGRCMHAHHPGSTLVELLSRQNTVLQQVICASTGS